MSSNYHISGLPRLLPENKLICLYWIGFASFCIDLILGVIFLSKWYNCYLARQGYRKHSIDYKNALESVNKCELQKRKLDYLCKTYEDIFFESDEYIIYDAQELFAHQIGLLEFLRLELADYVQNLKEQLKSTDLELDFSRVLERFDPLKQYILDLGLFRMHLLYSIPTHNPIEDLANTFVEDILDNQILSQENKQKFTFEDLEIFQNRKSHHIRALENNFTKTSKIITMFGQKDFFAQCEFSVILKTLIAIHNTMLILYSKRKEIKDKN